jgi:hypothetical protein
MFGMNESIKTLLDNGVVPASKESAKLMVKLFTDDGLRSVYRKKYVQRCGFKESVEHHVLCVGGKWRPVFTGIFGQSSGLQPLRFEKEKAEAVASELAKKKVYSGYSIEVWR